MEQTDFRGQCGAYHVDCHSCGADLHLVNWNDRREADGPVHCPYCGSEDIWYADEAVRNSSSEGWAGRLGRSL